MEVSEVEPKEGGDFRAELEALGFTVQPPPEAGRTTVWFFGFPTANEGEAAASTGEHDARDGAASGDIVEEVGWSDSEGASEPDDG
jgi:hypothetical protein